MSEIRASRKPSSSNTFLAASSRRARVSAPLRERGVATSSTSGAVADRGMSARRASALDPRALEGQTLRIGGDLVELRGDELGSDVGLVRRGPEFIEVEAVEL